MTEQCQELLLPPLQLPHQVPGTGDHHGLGQLIQQLLLLTLVSPPLAIFPFLLEVVIFAVSGS